MRSILFSLTLVLFTGCLTEAATTDQPTDDLDGISAVDADPDPTPDQPSTRDDGEDIARRLQMLQQQADWQLGTVDPGRPDYTPPEPECVVGKPLDPRCKHPH